MRQPQVAHYVFLASKGKELSHVTHHLCFECRRASSVCMMVQAETGDGDEAGG